MIELACYNCLSLKERAAIMRFKGVYLCSRQEPEFIVDLYQIDRFYVEAFYHERKNEIVQLLSFSSADPLQEYFNKIDMNELLEEPIPQA
jgi:hypothetical protein